mmetsp:Transcript_12091/g.30170  ORF Transcript_12091/g.30170 Transcript_12091/m.30170 type:complete len:301 (-) Transcript_12091:292-1194(-)
MSIGHAAHSCTPSGALKILPLGSGRLSGSGLSMCGSTPQISAREAKRRKTAPPLRLVCFGLASSMSSGGPSNEGGAPFKTKSVSLSGFVLKRFAPLPSCWHFFFHRSFLLLYSSLDSRSLSHCGSSAASGTLYPISFLLVATISLVNLLPGSESREFTKSSSGLRGSPSPSCFTFSRCVNRSSSMLICLATTWPFLEAIAIRFWLSWLKTKPVGEKSSSCSRYSWSSSPCTISTTREKNTFPSTSLHRLPAAFSPASGLSLSLLISWSRSCFFSSNVAPSCNHFASSWQPCSKMYLSLLR